MSSRSQPTAGKLVAYHSGEVSNDVALTAWGANILVLLIALLAAFLLSGCMYMSDYSRQHHLRLYERYRLVSHHDLCDGKPQDAIREMQKALSELEATDPPPERKVLSLLELAGIYLGAGNAKLALDSYNQCSQIPEANLAFAAQVAAGKGFCYLKLKQLDKAAEEFKLALQLYKSPVAKKEVQTFPIDLCQSCCAWGLKLIGESTSGNAKSSFAGNDPIDSACLSSRFVLSNAEEFRKLSAVKGTAAKIYGKSDSTESGTGGKLSESELQIAWEKLLRGGKRAEQAKDDVTAERYYKSALSLMRKNNDKTGRMQKTLQNLAFFYAHRGRAEESIPLLREEAEFQRARFGNGDEALAAPLSRYGISSLHRGDIDNADKALTESLAICDKCYGDKHPTSAIVRGNLAEVRLAQRRYAEAEKLAREASSILETRDPTNEVRRSTCLFTLARALAGQNRMKEANETMVKVFGPVHQPSPIAGYFDVMLHRVKYCAAKGDIKESKMALQEARRFFDLVAKNKPPRRDGLPIMPGSRRKLETLEAKFEGVNR